MGLFPWPITEFPLIPWFCPDERGVLEFKNLHIPRSLKLFLKKNPYTCTIDKAFDQVIEACARIPRESETHASSWITEDMILAYKKLHQMGFAHSAEAWDGEELVGGIYGVSVDGVFSGESMFRYKDNASKVALLHLVEHLKKNGIEWMDIQMTSKHMRLLGAETVTRDQYLSKLKASQRPGVVLF